MNWLSNNIYLFIFTIFVSTFLTLFTVPYAKKVGLKFGIIDDPDARKMHLKPTVRSGGLSIVVSFIFTLFFINIFFNNLFFNELYISKTFLVIVISTFSTFLIGLLDDIFIISYLKRLIAQILIAFFIWNNGIAIKNIDLSMIPLISRQNIQLNNFFSLIITILWFGGVTNSINWMDGLDGLAAGIAAILSFGIALISITNNQYLIALFAIILTGCCIGFLKNNFYPSKIMMGDGGSYFLGSSLAILSIVGLSNTNDQLNLILAFTLFLIPILDMVYVIVSRIGNGLSPFYPDRRHLHHRLINSGFTYKNTVIVIYFLNIVALIFALKFFL